MEFGARYFAERAYVFAGSLKRIPRPAAVFAAVLMSPLLAAAQMSVAETSFLKKCRDNIAPEARQLSPYIAAECLRELLENDAVLLNRLKEMSPGEISAILAYNNALVNLKGLLEDYEPDSPKLNYALEYVPPLRAMALGPEPEKIQAWAKIHNVLYRDDRQEEYSCGTTRQGAAEAKTESRVSAAMEQAAAGAAAYRAVNLEKKPVPSRINSSPVSTRTWDRLAARLLRVQNAVLTGPLAGEMRGTKAGDEIIAFFQDRRYSGRGLNILSFKIREYSGNSPVEPIAWWSPREKTLNISAKRVKEFIAWKGIDPDSLGAGGRRIRDLARYLAPHFIHEATHQRQAAWAGLNDLDFVRTIGKSYPSHLELETEAYSMAAAFVAEKAVGYGASYMAEIDSDSRTEAARFMRGGTEALRLIKGRGYTLKSFEGAASHQFHQILRIPRTAEKNTTNKTN